MSKKKKVAHVWEWKRDTKQSSEALFKYVMLDIGVFGFKLLRHLNKILYQVKFSNHMLVS